MSELIRKLKEKKYITKIKVRGDISDELLSKEISQTGSIKIVEKIKKGLKPPYAVMRETNPELMDVCVANGWVANNDYMTHEEACKLTMDDIKPYIRETPYGTEYTSKFKSLTHFEEFQWFKGIIEIPHGLCSGCNELISVVLPDSVININQQIFQGCRSLTTVTIPGSVTRIAQSMFGGCSSLASIVIPDGVEAIDYYAFGNCTSLASIEIPDSVIYIGEGAFQNCPFNNTLQEPGALYINKLLYKYNGTAPSSVDILPGTKSINQSAFSGQTNLESVSIPDSVEYIGINAFDGCSVLQQINLPNNLKSIENYVFRNCSVLDNIVIPNSVSSIGQCTFEGCISLSNISIPGSVKLIDYYAFKNCTSLTHIELPEGLETMNYSSFENCIGITSIVIPSTLTDIFNATLGQAYNDLPSAFKDCKLTSIQVAQGNPKYDSRNNCNAIIETETNKLILGCDNTVVPDNITEIYQYAFYGCDGLEEINIPNTVTKIGHAAFRNCVNLRSCVIPNSVTNVDEQQQYEFNVSRLFQGCTNLSSVTLSSSITNIGKYAFADCRNLHELTCLAMTAPEAPDANYGSFPAFSGTGADSKPNVLKVPTGATGYDTGQWLDPLCNAEKCGFTIEYI